MCDLYVDVGVWCICCIGGVVLFDEFEFVFYLVVGFVVFFWYC